MDMKNVSTPRENMKINVRPYTPADQEFISDLAPRLLIGAAPWIDSARMLEAIRRWIADSLTGHGNETMVFVAENTQGTRLGFASVARDRHFTGVPQAYIGELAVAETAEGRGVGTALVRACEQWAHAQGYASIALDTGSANERGRHFYARLGFKEESVRLVSMLYSVW